MSISVPRIAANLLQLLVDRGYELQKDEEDYLNWYRIRFGYAVERDERVGTEILPPPQIKRMVYSSDGVKSMMVILHIPIDLGTDLFPRFQKETHFLRKDQDFLKPFLVPLVTRASGERAHLLLVSAKPSSKANEDLANLTHPPLELETFTLQQMSVDPTRHCLTPKHKILTPEETERIRRKMKNLKYLNVIKLTDPVVRWYGCTPGQVIAFWREPLTGIVPKPDFRLVENTEPAPRKETEGEEGEEVEREEGEGGEEGEGEGGGDEEEEDIYDEP
jgi:DNA-directed RNA polymerase subunit H (RpoH/RPB5)